MVVLLCGTLHYERGQPAHRREIAFPSERGEDVERQTEGATAPTTPPKISTRDSDASLSLLFPINWDIRRRGA